MCYEKKIIKIKNKQKKCAPTENNSRRESTTRIDVSLKNVDDVIEVKTDDVTEMNIDDITNESVTSLADNSSQHDYDVIDTPKNCKKRSRTLVELFYLLFVTFIIFT